MKAVSINFTDDEGKTTKTYSTCSLKTGLMDNIFDIAERAENLKEESIKMSEVKKFYNDLKMLIQAVFKYQFTYEELNESVEQLELMRVFNELCANIGGSMKKN